GKFAQLPAATVGTEHAGDPDVPGKLAQIPRNVRRAAGIETFAGDFHYWHGRFRRNPSDLSPDEFVQHQVADNENSFRSGLGENLLEPSRVHAARKRKSEECRQPAALLRFRVKILDGQICAAETSVYC